MPNLRQLFFRHVAQTSPFPLSLEIIKAEGIYLFASDGKKYIDIISGISVSNLGHNLPEIIEAMKTQLDAHLHLMVYGEFIQSSQVMLANRLVELLPEKMSCVYFLNSGSEAVEGSLKLAKRFTGRKEIISFTNAYHGSTQGALSVCGNEELKNSFRPLLPDVRILPFNSKKHIEDISEKTACVIIEPIQGEAGVRIADKDFLFLLSKQCSDKGTLLIFDEIQTGIGRTGKLFAFQHEQIVPDILLLGKALGGGMPLSAFISSHEIMSSLSNNPALGHITTFGGHPLSCTASLAALKILTSGKLIEQVAAKENLFRKHLNHPSIKEIRGKGLILSLQFDSEELNKKIIDKCIQYGVLVDWFLFAPDCMRIAPPLIITEDEIIHSSSIIIQAINSST
jgi:acetylornithine/succinyldiaminopimelate/putrescine aminotransferase